jgi:hypothetical protein
MPRSYTEERLLVCEGQTDVYLFRQLLRIKAISGFDMDYPKIDDDPSGGVDKFGQHLRNVALQEDFIANVKTIIVVSDNDDNRAFGRVCHQIQHAGYSVPQKAGEFVSTRNRPRLGILMIPSDPPGCLETLCRQAAERKWPALVQPLNAYMLASPSSQWSATKQSKTAVECIMAATCRQQPEVTLGNLWQKDIQYHIPLEDPAFKDIVDFLGGL